MQLLLIPITCLLMTISCTTTENVASRFLTAQNVRADVGTTLEIDRTISPELAGARIVIPPGALQSDIDLTVSLQLTSMVDYRHRAASVVMVLEPEGTELAAGAELTLPANVAVDSSREGLLVEARDMDGHLVARLRPCEVSRSEPLTVTVSAPVFTRYQLAAYDLVPDENCGDDIDNDGDGLTDCANVAGWLMPQCQSACGDGIVYVAAGEVCDDGNNIDGDGCSADCSSNELCGNGIVDVVLGEVCDDGNNIDGDGCNATCVSDETCGNGIVDVVLGEVCDDGNNIDGDGCSADCRADEVCGNGILDVGEECDTVGESATCDADCTAPACGDAYVNPAAGEECDDAGESPTCDADCTLAACGDGYVNPVAGEECDDGNVSNGDGCSFACLIE